MIALFFGCVDGPGHYLWQRHHNGLHLTHVTREYSTTPWTEGIDCVLQPGCAHVKTSAWSYRDKPPIDGQVQSAGKLHHRDGWTALACWDRTGDRRGGSNSTFLFDTTLTFAEAVEQARIHFPEIVARMEAAAPLHESED